MMTSRSLASAQWQFRDAATRGWLPASVPGCVHTDLIAAGRIEDPFYGTRELELQWIGERAWEYRVVFQVGPEELATGNLDLVADGLDTIATVYLNGRRIAATENMFIGYRWPVKRLLRPGRNELLVHFRSAMDYVRKTRIDFTAPREYCDPVGNAVRIRKQPCQFGWDWGPRLITAGIWRDIRLEGWDENRLDHVQVTQQHRHDGTVLLTLKPDFALPPDGVKVTARCLLNGREVARATGEPEALTLRVVEPELWWPSGQGAQPLYDLEIVASSRTGATLGTIKKRIGLRTIVLDRHPDVWGETFQFVVNGRPIFAKGANWIPAHSFVTTLDRAAYARDLQAAAEAHMNCIRLWGGGIYENEMFYDLCDELGLLVWHDFMFSCALYPSDDAFQKSVREEAVYQVKRVHHRASLALWCGNNELAQLNGSYLREDPRLMKGYQDIFHGILPEVVAAHDGTTSYWPSSEWRGTFESGHALGEKSGDSHYWDVWHARHPVKDYEKWAFRFCSEFGMQSYSSPETNATFCPPDDDNVFGPSMENHQKNRSGNQVILDYVSLRYRYPKSQDALIYLSQLNQAYCMQVGVEHYRRLTPRCMGALYWQLNDCWPVASWSSIEFTGRWKALHHAARRFNAPALVSAHVPGDEVTTIGNYRRTSIQDVHVFTVYDDPETRPAVVSWDLIRLDGRKVLSGEKRVTLRYGKSVRHTTLRLGKLLEKHGREKLYLRLSLESKGRLLSENTVFLAPPRFIDFPVGKVSRKVRRLKPRVFEIELSTNAFLHAVLLNLPDVAHRTSDNYFDLHRDRRKTVQLTVEADLTVEQLKQALTIQSLVDSYL